jgi:HD-GYP domain-containing protein (c-di-GMP phosphodiesterase class II)
LLHDVGKMAISSEIWNKPGALAPDEDGINPSEMGFQLRSVA